MNRRIQDLEAEVGTPLFERRPRGVKLTTAGEMFVRYARSQIADAERMKSQVEDLRGLRRGPVHIACSQALAHDFLASRIATFQKKHPKVVFDLKVMDHERALAALAAYDVDLALVYRPARCGRRFALSPVFRSVWSSSFGPIIRSPSKHWSDSRNARTILRLCRIER